MWYIPPEGRFLTGLTDLKVLRAVKPPSEQPLPPPLVLASELSACTALTSLHFSSTALPPVVWQLAAMKDLTLDQCCPTAADAQAVSRLTDLRSLRLCNVSCDQAQLCSALKALTAPPCLSRLSLDGNGLTALPRLQPWTTQLSSLDLKRNRRALLSLA